MATLEGLRQAHNSMDNVVSTLEAKQDRFNSHLTHFQNQLTEISAKTIAAKAMKEAAGLMGDGDQSLETNVKALDAKIQDLLVEVEVAIRDGDEKWDPTATARGIGSVDHLLEQIETSSSIAAEIDKIQGIAK